MVTSFYDIAEKVEYSNNQMLYSNLCKTATSKVVYAMNDLVK